jgi:hypothetical protein
VAIICSAESAAPAILAHLKDYVTSGGTSFSFPMAIRGKLPGGRLPGVVRCLVQVEIHESSRAIPPGHLPQDRNTLLKSATLPRTFTLRPALSRSGSQKAGGRPGPHALRRRQPLSRGAHVGREQCVPVHPSLSPGAPTCTSSISWSRNARSSKAPSRTTSAGRAGTAIVTAPEAALDALDSGKVPPRAIGESRRQGRLRNGDVERIVPCACRKNRTLHPWNPRGSKWPARRVRGSPGGGRNAESLSPAEPDAGGRFDTICWSSRWPVWRRKPHRKPGRYEAMNDSRAYLEAPPGPR